MLEIKESTYYKNLTQPLRNVLLSKNIIFGSTGYLYKSDRLGFVLFRAAKNRYEIIVFRPGAQTEEFSRDNLADAVELSIQIVKLYIEGKL